MGGLTRRCGAINLCKWYQAVDTWLQYDVDIILFSEMQPFITTGDVPEGSFSLDYNPERTRKLGRGTGCVIHKQLLETCARINIKGAPTQSGFWVIHLLTSTLLIGAWYGPVKGNGRSVADCKSYWTAWSKALWQARTRHPTALIVAGSDANVILRSLHPEKTQDSIATEFEERILYDHNLQLANQRCPRRTHTHQTRT